MLRLLGIAAIGVGLAALVLRRCPRVPIASVGAPDAFVSASDLYARAVREALTARVRGVP